MKTMTIRNVDDELSEMLKVSAKRRGESVNACVIGLLKQSLGMNKERFKPSYDDLVPLKGTWSEKDYQEFVEATADFNAIDGELWK